MRERKIDSLRELLNITEWLRPKVTINAEYIRFDWHGRVAVHINNDHATYMIRREGCWHPGQFLLTSGDPRETERALVEIKRMIGRPPPQ